MILVMMILFIVKHFDYFLKNAKKLINYEENDYDFMRNQKYHCTAVA